MAAPCTQQAGIKVLAECHVFFRAVPGACTYALLWREKLLVNFFVDFPFPSARLTVYRCQQRLKRARVYPSP